MSRAVTPDPMMAPSPPRIGAILFSPVQISPVSRRRSARRPTRSCRAPVVPGAGERDLVGEPAVLRPRAVRRVLEGLPCLSDSKDVAVVRAEAPGALFRPEVEVRLSPASPCRGRTAARRSYDVDVPVLLVLEEGGGGVVIHRCPEARLALLGPPSCGDVVPGDGRTGDLVALPDRGRGGQDGDGSAAGDHDLERDIDPSPPSAKRPRRGRRAGGDLTPVGVPVMEQIDDLLRQQADRGSPGKGRGPVVRRDDPAVGVDEKGRRADGGERDGGRCHADCLGRRAGSIPWWRDDNGWYGPCPPRSET